MKIKTTELQKALDYLKKNGDAQELSIVVMPHRDTQLQLLADAMGDEVLITLYESDLNVFPKITKTERL